MNALHEKSPAELEALIENWMLALGAMSTPEMVLFCTGRIKEAEAILQAKREADEVFHEDLEAAGDMLDSLVHGDFYQRQEEAHNWLRRRA